MDEKQSFCGWVAVGFCKSLGLPRFGSVPVRFQFGSFQLVLVLVRSGSGSILVPIRFFLIEKSILGSKKKIHFLIKFRIFDIEKSILDG